MNEFVKMDIFFVVTTLAVALLTGAIIFVLWKVWRVLKNVEHISEQVSAEADMVRADLAEVRSGIQKGKGRFKSFWRFFSKTAKRH